MKVTIPTSEGPAAGRPAFEAVLEQLARYRKSKGDNLPTAAEGALGEIENRVGKLARLYDELMEINSKVMAAARISVKFDPSTNTITYRFGEIEERIILKRADPNVPIQRRNLGESAAYLAGAESFPVDPGLRSELEGKLESFYYIAHRVLKLFKETDDLPRIRCMPVTIVRNKLIEHPTEDQFYSFGVGSTGPLVKPMHRGDVHFHDAGLSPNASAWCKAIIDGLSRVVTPT
jgi:hypothetical protein